MKKRKCFVGIMTTAVLLSAPLGTLAASVPVLAAEEETMSAKEMAEGFTMAYTGKYNDTLDIVMGFDDTNGLGLVAMYEPGGKSPEWVCMGTFSIDDDGNCVVENSEEGTSFSFQIVEETEKNLEIKLEDGQLTLDTAEPSIIEEFLEWMYSNGKSEFSPSKASENASEKTSEKASEKTSGNAAELAEGFDLAYFGTYSDTQEILLAFDTTNELGLAAITNPDKNTLDWVCRGDWLGDDGDYQFKDSAMGTTFDFTIEEESDDSITIGLKDGTLTLKQVDVSEVADFFTKMEEGEFAQE